jgi:uroporphyrinogen-III decarboxylase
MPSRIPWGLLVEPELKTELAGTKLGAYYTDPEVLLTTNRISARQMHESYGWGSPELKVISVTEIAYHCASALGAHVSFPEDASPQIRGRLIGDLGDIQKLRVPADIATVGYFPHLIERYEYVRKRSLATGVEPRFGLPAQSPLGTAVLLRGTELFTDLIVHPGEVKALLELITETAIRVLRFQEDFTGQPLDGVGMDDDYGGLFSPTMHEEFNFPYMKRIYDAFETESRWLHTESFARGHLRFVRELGITSYDAWPYRGLTVEDVKAELPDIYFSWNIETAKDLFADAPARIKEKYRHAVAVGAPAMALDLCARSIPPENIKAFVEVAREFE